MLGNVHVKVGDANRHSLESLMKAAELNNRPTQDSDDSLIKNTNTEKLKSDITPTITTTSRTRLL